MSLKVWLPFNGNLNNYGCSDVTAPTYNNLTLVSNGKIGQCYSGQAVYYLTNELLGNIWSLCAWIKADGWYSSNNVILCKNVAAGDAYQFYFSIVGGTQLRIGINNNSGIVFNYTFNTGTWYHVAATYDGSIGNLYINGELKKSSSVSNAFSANMNNIGINCRSANADGTTRWIGDSSVHYINDARIYDHCLSAAEVREISQGLVLHYKLDDITNGIKDSSGYNYNGTLVGSPTISSDSARYSNCLSFNGSTDAVNCGKAFIVQGATEMTWTGWFNCNSWRESGWQYLLSSQQSGGILLGKYSTCTIRARAHVYTAADKSTTGYSADANYTATETEIPAGSGWHMITGVYTTSAIKLYIDGELKKTTSSTTYGVHFNTNANMFIAAESTGAGSSDYATCKASDIRVYYTALSDEDVKQLYELRAKIDNKQNLHLINLYEGTDSNISGSTVTYTNTGTSTISVGTYPYPITFSETPNPVFTQYTINRTQNNYQSSIIDINPYSSFRITLLGDGIHIASQPSAIQRYQYTMVGYNQQGRPVYKAYQNGTYTFSAVKYSIDFDYLDAEGNVLASGSLLDRHTYGEYNSMNIYLNDETFNLSAPAAKYDSGYLFTSMRIRIGIIGAIFYDDNNAELYPEHTTFPYQTKIRLKSNGNFLCDTLYESEATKLFKNKCAETNNLIEF